MATEAELIAAGYLNDPGYQRFRQWFAGGGQHGTLGGKVLNPAVVRSRETPWGENIHYDAAGNVVSLYMDAPPGVTSPYGPPGGGPSAPPPPGQTVAAPTSQRQAVVSNLAGSPPPGGFQPPPLAPTTLEGELTNRLARWSGSLAY